MTQALRRTIAGLVALLATATLAAGAGSPASGAETGLLMQRKVIGTSVEGRDIVAFHRHFRGARRTVVVIGAIHGDEKAGMRVIRRLKRLTPPRNLDLWLIPTVNPDGVAADRRTNAHGVDLNRNFPYRWRRINVGKETYSGPSALSEPESQALHDFVKDVDPRLTVTFHQPLFGVGLNVKRNDVVRALATAMHLPTKDFACTGVCYGSFTSWYNHRLDGVAVTAEFGDSPVSDWRIRKAASSILTVGPTA